MGLGNPGPAYAATRHNVGAWFVAKLAEHSRTSLTPLKGYTLQGATINAGSIVTLLRSTQYMNLSGESVVPYLRYHRVLPEQLLVAHDEMDLLPGTIKLKFGGGHAGHRGLENFVRHLGSSDFWRLRIGIGHPRALNLPMEVVDFVVSAPSPQDREAIDVALDRATTTWPLLQAGHYQEAMGVLHQQDRPGPPLSQP